MSSFEFLGPYRVGRLIGRGGMGAVYEAVHDTSGERVAVKLISSTIADDVTFRRRFAAEVETLKRLRHPNIVRLIGYGEESGHLFYSMELVEGESLQQRIRRLKRIDWLPTIEIAIHVSGALKHAHDFGVIHRDLKPANLLLTSEGTVKLVDFGIAKLFGSIDQTVAGSVLGTADFMAPEQAGEGVITPRTDLYALGSVLYAMLTGRPPFSGKRLTEVIDSLKRERPVPLELIDPELPDEVVSLVHDLLEKEPGNRPPTALAVLNRLKAIRVGLQREQTLRLDTSKTVASKRPDRAAEDSGEHAGADANPQAGDEATDRGTATQASRPGLGDHATSPSLPAGDPSPRRVPPVASPDDATLVSENTFRPGASEDEDDFEVVDPPRSHYQAIDPADHSSGLFDVSRDDDRFGWVQAVSIAGMIAVLVVGIGVIAYAFRQPSADQLYAQIASAEDAGDLTSAEPAIRRFLTLYPDDPRTEEIGAYAETISLERSIRRLQTKANRAGGNERLDPIEQVFLEAMDARAREPERAREMLTAWLDVYAPGGEPDDVATRRLAAMVRQELEKLRHAMTRGGTDVRARRLLDRVAWGRDNLSPDDYRRMLQGMIELFKDEPWASPAVSTVRAELNAIDRGADGRAPSERGVSDPNAPEGDAANRETPGQTADDSA